MVCRCLKFGDCFRVFAWLKLFRFSVVAVCWLIIAGILWFCFCCVVLVVRDLCVLIFGLLCLGSFCLVGWGFVILGV